MQKVRRAAVAGHFYQDSKDILSNDVVSMLAAATPAGNADAANPDTTTLHTASITKALIVPHAGYIYSGAVAASAYRLLQPAHDTIKRVVLLGPTHRVPVFGMALPEAEAFETPLGKVQLDLETMKHAREFEQVTISDKAHLQEHSLEVQLPFLQTVLDDFSLVPFAVGRVTPVRVAEVLDALWGGPETLIVISSDLSHFHPYSEAIAIDTKTAEHILQLDATVSHDQACGGTPVNGMMVAARQHKLLPRLLDIRNSGDTAGDRKRVVGYAAFAFLENSRPDPSEPVSNGLHQHEQ